MTRSEGLLCSTKVLSFSCKFQYNGLLVKENLLELHLIMLILSINWNSTEISVNAGSV